MIHVYLSTSSEAMVAVSQPMQSSAWLKVFDVTGWH